LHTLENFSKDAEKAMEELLEDNELLWDICLPQGGPMSGGVQFEHGAQQFNVGGAKEERGEGNTLPLGSIVPESILTSLGVLLQQIEGSVGADQTAGLVTLRQNIETLEKKGFVSEGDIETLLKDQLTLLADNPKLPKVQQEAVHTFLDQLNKTPRGSIPLSGGSGNPFLESSAILELFKMTAKITIELAQIQLKEALMRIHEMELQKEAASCAATLTKEAGEVAAEKELIQAQAAYAQAGIALAGALSAAVTCLGSFVESRRAFNDYKNKHSDPKDTVNYDPQWEVHANEIQTQVEQRWNRVSAGIDKVNDASRSFTDAIMHKELSSRELQEATLKAAADFLRTLGDLQAQAASTLGQSVSGLEQEIKAFFDKYIESMRGWGQAWGRG
jgi:hypothetical protein